MNVTAMLPGSKSQARRRARMAAEAVRHPRAARRGAKGMAAGMGVRQAILHPRAARRGRRTAGTARALPLATLAETAWILAGRPRRQRRSKATMAAGAAGVAGAGAAAAYVISRKSGENGHAGENGQASDSGPRVHTTPEEGHPAGTGVRTDRDIGGPTAPEAPNQGATGGAPGTPPDSGFEPH